MTASRSPRQPTLFGSPGVTTARDAAASLPPRRAVAERSLRRTPLPRKNLLIRASAGTGKTYQLSGCFIDRLRTSPPERILATTFTRAAAAEILERVLLRLAEAALQPRRLTELAGQLQPLNPEPLTRDECLDRLADLTSDLHRVRVGTLDSFFIQTAQSFALELGLPPGWRILDSVEESQLVTQAIESLLQSDQRSEVGQLLNLTSKGDAGRSIISRVRSTVREFYEVYLETSADAWRLIPEPPPLSTEDYKEAVNQLEFCRTRLPGNKNWIKAYEKDIKLLADQDWEEFGSAGLAGAVDGDGTYYKKPIPPELVGAYRPLLAHGRAILVRQLASRTRVTWDLLDRFHAEFAALKHEQRGLTFSDVTRALAMGWRSGQLSQLDFRMDAAIEHLLLDEFQDTSVLQWQALEPLARQVTGDESNSLFCVGDQKQAIYGWRGGAAELFDALQDRLPDLHGEPLQRSYRSSSAVIEAVNRVGAGLSNFPDLDKAAPAVERWQGRFDSHETALQGLPGCVTLETPLDGELLFEFAADRVREIHRDVPAATIGVLVRTNSAVAELARMLRMRGLIISEEGKSSLDDNVAVSLIISILQLADWPGHQLAHRHLAESPIAAALQVSIADDDVARDAVSLRFRRELLDEGYGRCVERWAELLAPHCDPRGVSRLRQLVDLAHAYERHASLRPGDFIQFIEAQPQLQPAAAKIRVMTVHHSKGLEFDVVVLPELDKRLIAVMPNFVTGCASPVEPPNAVLRYANERIRGMLPEPLQQIFRAAHERKVEEQLSVLYVAMTRARFALHLLVEPASAPVGKGLSMAGLLRAALTEGGPLPPATRLVMTGDADWFTAQPNLLAAPAAAVDSSTTTSPAPLEIHLAASAGGPAPEEVQPSRHHQGLVRLENLLEPVSIARQRGVLFHAWFEQLHWLDAAAPGDDALRKLARQADFSRLDIDCCLEDFRAMVAAPDIAALFSQTAALSPQGPFQALLKSLGRPAGLSLRVQNERRFIAPIDAQIIRGCIDRLVLLERDGVVIAADICDFKTDALEHLAREARAERLDRYHNQLNLYRRAVAHIYNLPQTAVGARLVLLESRRVEATV